MPVELVLRYYNDIWVYEIHKLEWRSVSRKDASSPSPRGEYQRPVCCMSMPVYAYLM